MWLISGTVPEAGFSLQADIVADYANLKGDRLVLADGTSLHMGRGTIALVATAAMACQILGAPAPRLLLAGDQGTGVGSRSAYEWLLANISSLVAERELLGITFHYFYPDLDWHNRLVMAIEELKPRPMLVADAGFMYAAKMSGYASQYDLFTPDIGELAFLADEKAPHPFYTRGFLSAGTDDVPGLLARAIKHENCPPNMIIKGKRDYIVCNKRLVAQIAEPAVEAMECIGGTGDIVTGLVTAYLASGYPVCESAIYAARAARHLAAFCNPDPSWQVAALIMKIKPMFEAHRGKIENRRI